MFATAEWVHRFNTVRPHSAIGMHAPIEYEQAYTPPPQEDTNTIADSTDIIADGTDIIDTADAQDVGEQTTINQPQPTTTGAR
ncbi:integrase core domain-containing protein [Actinomyces procaprae]|uniref:integrase core domain-containing protein n=1 Tax=Actinomyces procaprae TaxID=2560010 RepID=UPI00109D8B49|nr:integrase core domain-containing protein [Actinomyces procaprae]